MSLAPFNQPAWNVGDSLPRVVDALRGRVASIRSMPDGSYLVNCINPAHEDRHPSLHISHQPTEHGGRTLFRCFSCADGPTQEDWAVWSGLEYDDLFDDRRWGLRHRDQTRSPRPAPRRAPQAPSVGRLGPLPKPVRHDLGELLGGPARPPEPKHTHDYERVEAYVYLDEAGRPVHRVQRLRCTECGDKEFPQQYLSKGGDPFEEKAWESSQAKAGYGKDWVPRLYRHQQVLDAVADGVPVWLLEGEKDVHTAEGNALVATTNPGGATSFPAALAPVFRGATVNVVLDRDAAGWARGVRLADLLPAAGAATVRLWLPATTAAKSDLTDHVEAGHGIDDLVPVPVGAVAAWHTVSSALAGAVKTILAARDEADAQLQVAQVAQVDRAAGRKVLAEDRRRFATRWTHEALRQHTRAVQAVQKAVDQVATVGGQDPARDWAIEALEVAGTQLRTATTTVHAVADQTGTTVPPQVDQAQVTLAEAIAEARSGIVSQDLTVAETRPELQVIHGGGGGREVPGVTIERDRYEIVQDEIVQVNWRRRGEDWVKTFKRVVNAPLRLTVREFAESEDDIDADALQLDELGDRGGRAEIRHIRSMPQVTHVLLAVPTPDSDGPALLRVPFDDYIAGTFLPHLPIAKLDYLSGRSGREKVISAINQVSDPQHLTAYRATGWRRRPDGTSMYITAAGAIDAHGWSPVSTNLDGTLSRFDLPDPTTDPARVREAFLTAAAPMLDRFPDRVGAVLVGTAFRAAMCTNEWVTVLSSSPGVGKTGLAALTMHFYGEMWDRMRPMSSMSGNGSTDNALRIMAHQAKDALAFLDDNAPTAGIDQAWKRLESIGRMLHNQEARSRATRDGQGVLPGSRPRTSGLVTTELPPRPGASGGRRLLVVPLSRRDVDTDDIIALDDLQLRHRRALLMASFLQWVAADHRGHLLRCRRLRDDYLVDLRNRRDVPARIVEHHGVKVAELWGGWGLLLEWLLESGALSPAEHTTWTERVREALLVAAEASEDPDMVESTGQRACELLRFALTNGLAYVADADTGKAPHGLERRLGWRASSYTTLAGPADGTDWRVDPRAIHLGHVQQSPTSGEPGPELLCDRSGLDAALKAAAAAMTDTTGIDLGTVLRALEDEGVLKTQLTRGGAVVRRTLERVIGCLPDVRDPQKPLRERRIVLRLAQLFGQPGDGPTLLDPEPDPHGPPPAPQDAGPAEPDQPAPVEDLQESTVDHTNTGGLTLATVLVDDAATCLSCGHRCGVTFGGIPLHIPCFEATTSSQAGDLRTELTQPPTPRPSRPANEPATAEPATAEPATAGRGLGVAPPTGRARGTVPAFRSAVAVVDVDAVWFPDGTSQPLTSPVTHLGHLERLGRDLNLGQVPVGRWRTYPQAGTIVPTAALWRQLGLNIDELPRYTSDRKDWLATQSQDLPAVLEAAAAGWVFGTGQDTPTLKASTTIRRHDTERAAVKIVMLQGQPAEFGLDDQVAPAAIARRLQLFADTVGIPFGGSPLNAALDLFAAIAPKAVRDALVPVDWAEVPPARQTGLEQPFDWSRPPTPAEQDAGQIAFFDRGQSYFATWSTIAVGLGAPDHHDGPVRFNPKQAGWWRITVPGNTIDGIAMRLPHPDLLDPTGTQAGNKRWVTTPALAYALQHLDVDPEIHEAYLWPVDRSKRVLDPMYKHLTVGLKALHALQGATDGGDPDVSSALRMVKATYKQLFGYFASDAAAKSTSPLHQPYWNHAIIAQARVAMIHLILRNGAGDPATGQPGAWPLVVANTDMIGYPTASLDDHGAAAWPGDTAKLGIGPGQYKPVRHTTIADQLKYLTGRAWRGLAATHTFDDTESAQP